MSNSFSGELSLGHFLKYHMDGDTYIACEQLDYAWSRSDLREIVDMWKLGVPIDYISEHFGRPDEECAIILMDLAMHGIIKYRAGGLLGRANTFLPDCALVRNPV